MADKVKNAGKKVKDDIPEEGNTEGTEEEEEKVQSDKTTEKLKVKSEEKVEAQTAGGEVKEAVIETKNEEAVVTEEKDEEAVITDEKEKEAVVTEEKDEEAVVTDEKEKEAVVTEEKDEEAVVTEEKDKEALVTEEKDEEAVVTDEKDKEAVVSDEKDKEAVVSDMKVTEPKRPAGPERKRGAYAGRREQTGPARSEEFRGDRGRRVYFRRKVCRLCVNKINSVDYKDVDLLRRFVTDRGKIMPRRMTGTCARHQRIVSAAVKRARMIALLPFVTK